MKQSGHIEFAISESLVPYQEAVAYMEARARAIWAGEAAELLWFLEHPPLYTAGTSAKETDLIDAGRFPVHSAGRGGEYTYHGPGQRVAYLMLDVGARGKDVRAFVQSIEQWIIDTLSEIGLQSGPREGRVGVWVDHPAGAGTTEEDKIAAIGVRLKRWVSYHGVSLNVNPNLEHFSGITACGIADPRYGITSLADLGIRLSMADVDDVLANTFQTVFGASLMRVDAPKI